MASKCHFNRGVSWFKKSLGPTVVTCSDTGSDTEQPGRHAGDPTFSQHSDTKLQSTPMQHLAEAGGCVIVSVTVQA